MFDFFDNAYIGAMNKACFCLATIDVYELENESPNNVFAHVDDTVKSTGKGLYHSLLLIGGFGAVIMLIIAFMYYAIAGSGNNKEQAKSRILVVLFATAGIFAAIALVALFQTIGDGIKTELKP